MNTAPWYLNKWRDKVDTALQDHSDNGTPITLAHWTTELVNKEVTFNNDSKKNSARIYSASTGSGSAYGGDMHRDHDAVTGMPHEWKVSGIDITIFYGNVGKAEKQSYLPKLTWKWFKNNPNAKCFKWRMSSRIPLAAAITSKRTRSAGGKLQLLRRPPRRRTKMMMMMQC